MAITAALVKELRERTSSGMMECKKALVETNGDIEAAIELMRKTGMAKADKKTSRIAAEGTIVIKDNNNAKQAVIVEVNCETDFVTKGEDFQSFAKSVAETALANNPADIDALLQLASDSGDSISDTTKKLIVKIGEKISVRRFKGMANENGSIASYLHGSRIGVIVDMTGGTIELGKDIAMHIAASKPICVSADDVSPELIAKEKEIFSAQAADSGKPPEIVEKMVSGRINKYLKEITLLGQPFVKDPDKTIEQLLKEADCTINRFTRYEVGEGIEKKTENFADEVMAQVKGS